MVLQGPHSIHISLHACMYVYLHVIHMLHTCLHTCLLPRCSWLYVDMDVCTGACTCVQTCEEHGPELCITDVECAVILLDIPPVPQLRLPHEVRWSVNTFDEPAFHRASIFNVGGATRATW